MHITVRTHAKCAHSYLRIGDFEIQGEETCGSWLLILVRKSFLLYDFIMKLATVKLATVIDNIYLRNGIGNISRELIPQCNEAVCSDFRLKVV